MIFLGLSGRNRGLLVVCSIWGTLRQRRKARQPQPLNANSLDHVFRWGEAMAHSYFTTTATSTTTPPPPLASRTRSPFDHLKPCFDLQPMKASDEVKCCAPAIQAGG